VGICVGVGGTTIEGLFWIVWEWSLDVTFIFGFCWDSGGERGDTKWSLGIIITFGFNGKHGDIILLTWS
jgi:hypothetical protein